MKSLGPSPAPPKLAGNAPKVDEEVTRVIVIPCVPKLAGSQPILGLSFAFCSSATTTSSRRVLSASLHSTFHLRSIPAALISTTLTSEYTPPWKHSEFLSFQILQMIAEVHILVIVCFLRHSHHFATDSKSERWTCKISEQVSQVLTATQHWKKGD